MVDLTFVMARGLFTRYNDRVASKPEAAGILRLPEGSPAFCLESLFNDFDGRPVSWGRFLCRADQFRLTSQLGVSMGRTEEQSA